MNHKAFFILFISCFLNGIALLYLYFPGRRWDGNWWFNKKYRALDAGRLTAVNIYHGKGIVMLTFCIQALFLIQLKLSLDAYYFVLTFFYVIGAIFLRNRRDRLINKLYGELKELQPEKN